MYPLIYFFLLASLLTTNACFLNKEIAETDPPSWTVSIPAGGNSWVVNQPEKDEFMISQAGIQNWSDPRSRIRIFFRLEQPGELQIGLRARAPEGAAVIKCSFSGEARPVAVAESEWSTISIGSFEVEQPGYYWLELQGIQKTGATFAELADIQLGGAASQGTVYYVKDAFYWGRRGPSVHLRYDIPAEVSEAEWFYSEITIPEGQDVLGSYFMANGFGEGYFGIQVNSATERRILFSVWSPYQTDNPADIPESQRIRLLRKGPEVYSGEFGNEGSGGQSYLKYFWKAETTYRFLVRGQPSGENTTDYTAYFYAPEQGRWMLIASFRRPQTRTYLRNLYAFLENFLPETGHISRMGRYSNQWICDSSGRWHELTAVRFTADDTARKKARLDYSGGVNPGGFYLKNCGFFNETTLFGSTFQRPASGKAPGLDFGKLP